MPIVPFRPPCPATAAFVFRTYSSAPPTVPTGPNQDVLPHVSAEAATTAKIAGGTPPDLEQGTPISEVPLSLPGEGVAVLIRHRCEIIGDQTRPANNGKCARRIEGRNRYSRVEVRVLDIDGLW